MEISIGGFWRGEGKKEFGSGMELFGGEMMKKSKREVKKCGSRVERERGEREECLNFDERE